MAVIVLENCKKLVSKFWKNPYGSHNILKKACSLKRSEENRKIEGWTESCEEEWLNGRCYFWIGV